jgi:hypothetical protein
MESAGKEGASPGPELEHNPLDSVIMGVLNFSTVDGRHIGYL